MAVPSPALHNIPSPVPIDDSWLLREVLQIFCMEILSSLSQMTTFAQSDLSKVVGPSRLYPELFLQQEDVYRV